MNLLESSAPSNLTVLLVDDSQTVLAMYGSALATEGFRVLKATTTAEAIELIRSSPISVDLLATDIVLPDTLRLMGNRRPGTALQGLELMRQVAQLRPEIKTILFSGQSEEILKRGGVLNSGVPFLRKPFSVETFLRMVQTVLSPPVPRVRLE